MYNKYIVIAIIILVCVFGFCYFSKKTCDNTENYSPNNITTLLIEQAYLINLAQQSLHFNSPNTKEIVDATYANSDKIAKLVGKKYGEHSYKKVNSLLEKYVLITLDFVTNGNTEKLQNEYTTLLQEFTKRILNKNEQWKNSDISRQLNELFKFNIESANSLRNGDYDRHMQLLEKIIDIYTSIGNIISSGLEE